MRSKFVPVLFVGLLAITTPGCARPSVPSLTGQGMFHDITQIKKGMSQGDVQRIMGSRYTPIMEEGLQGMDSGIFAWDYAEGRVYFNTDGVTRVVSAK